MRELEHRLTNDLLFKMLFVRREDLLRKLVAALLSTPLESITDFTITNPDIPPDMPGEKFCRLDINMTVDGQRVDLEVQVADEGDYPDRSLYYWAREFSSALTEGGKYSELPRTVVVSILGFNQFRDTDGYHSEFEALEVKRHSRLTDKLSLHYFELTKLPKEISAEDGQKLWLALFAATTEDDLERIEKLEVTDMAQAIGAYREIVVEPEFRERERLRFLAKANEASALEYARRQERAAADEEWKLVVAERDMRIAELLARLGE